MKSYLHNFKGFSRVPSTIKIYILKAMGDDILIGFEDLNEGTSVTNASEQLATEIIDKEGLVPENCRFFEWYSQYEGDVDEITYTWDSNRKANQPVWKPFCKSDQNPFKL